MKTKEVILDVLKSEGKSKNRLDTDFNPIELKIGEVTEKEHANDVAARREIAKDHLDENPWYYTEVLAPKEKDVMETTLKILKKFGFDSIVNYRKNYKWKNKEKKYK